MIPSPSPYTALLVIPTGIGARIGGYAGDAIPIARTLAAAVDRLITHPNVLNGASLFWPLANTFYVEGYGLDQFCRGVWGLRPVRQNRVGVLLDAALDADLKLQHLLVMQGAQATLGLEIPCWRMTERPLGVSTLITPAGTSQGSLADPEALLRGAEQLIQEGATAIAVVARFPDDLDFRDYDQGAGVDPLAGVEAVISHLLVRELGIPAAHAPAFQMGELVPVHPRAAAESVGYTFLPSVLAGLSYAPQFVKSEDQPRVGDLSVEDVDVVIVPSSAFGGPGILHFASRDQPPLLLAIEENTTALQVCPENLQIQAVRVRSYIEAVGVVTAHRAGISINTLIGQ
jgi:hypothetical protein